MERALSRGQSILSDEGGASEKNRTMVERMTSAAAYRVRLESLFFIAVTMDSERGASDNKGILSSDKCLPISGC